ncbi:MAG: hypothetical protein ABFD63_01765 [Smithella sp.]
MDTYDFESKHIYRKRRESAIDRLLNIPIKMRRVAYLDTKEALDTISYLKRGYRAENLWAINNNPAELAHLTMKLDKLSLPKVNTVGLDFEYALDHRIPAVDVIDFDGMGNVGNKMAFMLGKITESRPNAVYGVTVLAGRETDNIYGIWVKNLPPVASHTSFGTLVHSRHSQRLFVLLNIILNGNPCEATKTYKRRPTTDDETTSKDHWYSNLHEEYGMFKDDKSLDTEWDVPTHCRIHITKLYWDIYMSTSKQPMLWCVCKCEPHREIKTVKSYLRLTKDVKGLVLPYCTAGVYR